MANAGRSIPMRSKGADLQTPRRRDDRRAQRVDDALNVDTHGRAVQGSLRHVELELLRAHEGCVELPIWPKEAPGEELAPELALVEKPFFVHPLRNKKVQPASIPSVNISCVCGGFNPGTPLKKAPNCHQHLLIATFEFEF